MSFWQSVFGKAKNFNETAMPGPAAPRPAARNAVVADHFLTVHTPPFYGVAYTSANKRWVAGCADYDAASGRGGCRDSGNGRVVLVDVPTDAVVLELTSLARPTDAAIADDGTLALVESDFGLALASTLLVFDATGRRLLARRFQANMYSIGISRCGRFTVAQTCINPEGDDGNRLEVAAIASAQTLFSRAPATAWADQYDFRLKGDQLEQVRVKLKGLGWFRYATDGTFLDDAAYLTARLTKGDYATALTAARELLTDTASLADAKRCLDAADRALQVGATADAHWSAQAHRLRGEAYERLDDPTAALDAYTRALAADPAIGVRRRVTALTKRQQP